VTPAVFLLFGRKVYRPEPAGEKDAASAAWDDAWMTERQGGRPRPEVLVALDPVPKASAETLDARNGKPPTAGGG
jgi:hypothetical protein